MMPSGNRTAAQDCVLRLSLGMWAADTRAALTVAQRAWVVERLSRHVPGTTMAVPFSNEERAKLREPLCLYVQEYHPRIADIVARQFGEPEERSEPVRRLHHDERTPLRSGKTAKRRETNRISGDAMRYDTAQ